MEERPRKLDDPVKWSALIPLLASVVLVVTLIVGGGISRADATANRAIEAATAAVARAEQGQAEIRNTVATNKAQQDAGNAELRKDVQAIYNYMLTKQRQPRLEKP